MTGPGHMAISMLFGRVTYIHDPETDSVYDVLWPCDVTINGRCAWGRRFTKASFDRAMSILQASLFPKEDKA